MKYAVIKTGGKQYRVQEGDIIEVEHMTGAPNDAISFEDVLLYTNEGAYEIGTPTVGSVTVTGTIVDHFRGEKIRVGKFKSKVRHRRVMGHRQSLSRIKIEMIGGKTSSSRKAAASEKKEEKTEAKPSE